MNDAMSGLSSASMSLNFGGIMDLSYDSGTVGTILSTEFAPQPPVPES
jgi:hypothetical protein